MKNKVIGVLIMLMMFFSVKGFVSAKTITTNDFANEINKFSQYGVNASVDSATKKITINYTGSPLMIASYNDNYIEYDGRNHTSEYYSNHQNEIMQRNMLTSVINETIKNLYGVTDNYEQYGIQYEEDEIVVTNNGATIWDEIVYFKLPLNTDNINNGTTNNENNETNNGTTNNENNETNNGTTNNENNEVNNGTTNNTNNETNNGTTNNTSNEVNNGTTNSTSVNVTNETTKDENNTSDVVTNKTQYNPNTGDNILLYIGAFVVLVMGSIITVKKVIINK